LVFLGLMVLARPKASALTRWLWTALGLFLLPGLLTNIFEPFRVVLLAPLLVVTQALGLGWLLSRVPSPRPRVRWGIFLVGLLTVLDLYHLWGPYREAWGEQGPKSSRFKPIESWRAYDLLKEKAGKEGPGIILTDLQARPDPAFRVAVHPFNAAERGRPKGEEAAWAAYLVQGSNGKDPSWVDPTATRSWLSSHLRLRQGGLYLVTLPRGSVPADWIQAQEDLREAGRILLEAKGKDPVGEARAFLEGRREVFRGDAFLEEVLRIKLSTLGSGSGP
jgi:hypothetical protein